MAREADATDIPDTAAAPNTATKHRWRIFAIVSAALMMSSIDQTIVATALSALKHDLHAPINWASWTVTVYALGRTLGFPMLGRLSDQYNRRTVFGASVAVFTLASLGCGFANDIYLLIVLRAIQALGGSAFVPSATGLIAEHFGSSRDRAVGLFSSIVPAGAIIGPILGGIFVAYLSWRWIFLVNVPIGMALIIVALRYIPASGRRGPPQRVDIPGMLAFGLAILGAMTAISFLGEPGGTAISPPVLAAAVVAAAAAALFVWHLRRSPAPFIPPKLLSGQLATMNLMNLLYGAAALGFTTLVPLYASERYGIDALSSGLLLTARAVGMISLSAAAAMLLRRTGYRWPVGIGFLVIAAGFVGMALPAAGSPRTWLFGFAALTGVGVGIAQPATNNASIQLAPDQVSAIVGLRGMFRQAGSIAAVSITTAVLARSADPGITQAYLLTACAALLLVALILFLRGVPDHRGGW